MVLIGKAKNALLFSQRLTSNLDNLTMHAMKSAKKKVQQTYSWYSIRSYEVLHKNEEEVAAKRCVKNLRKMFSLLRAITMFVLMCSH